MHIHKINTTSQEHQNFLAQNRKDPITGDSILEGDEVAFCASCKSVFLKDTWEYLGKQHCKQSKTLIDFPLEKMIHLRVDDEVLFYKALVGDTENLFNIPNKAKKTPWVYKKKFLSSYDNFQESNLYTGLFMLVFSFISLVLSFFTSNFFTLFSIPVILLLLVIVGKLHDLYYIKKVNIEYQKFYSNTFYISKKTVGFATNYGKKHYVLHVEYIEKIVFRHIGTRVQDKYFKLFYREKGVEKLEHVTCYLSDKTFEDPFSLFDSLRLLSQNKDIQINIESIEQDTIMHLKELNEKWNTNFFISY